MPASLPDPVLALSMASIQKLNSADIDQLANLWNVFTKCKESLESGRRLENLSWRLWFREAHLLPPDASLSDMSDFTPLGTPLTSRRSSINGGSLQQQGRVMAPFQVTGVPTRMMSGHATADAAAGPAVLNSAAMASPSRGNVASKQPVDGLSDPESADDWSDESSGDEGMSEAHDAKLGQHAHSPSVQSPQQGSSKALERGREGLRLNSKPASPSSSNAGLSSSRRERLEMLTSPTLSLTAVAAQAAAATTPTSLRPAATDRRRAISSSSAFGSRARVKQANMHHRHKPLSFQQAVESLLRPDAGIVFSRDKANASTISGVPNALRSDEYGPSQAIGVAHDPNSDNQNHLPRQEQAELVSPTRSSAPPCLVSHGLKTPSVPPACGDEAGPSASEAGVNGSAQNPNHDHKVESEGRKKGKRTHAARFFVGPESLERTSVVEPPLNPPPTASEADQIPTPGLRQGLQRTTSTHSSTKSTSDTGQGSQQTRRVSRGRGRGRIPSGYAATGRSRSTLGHNRRSLSGNSATNRVMLSRERDTSEETVDTDDIVAAEPRDNSHQENNSKYISGEASKQRPTQEQSREKLPKGKAPVKFHMGSLGSEEGSEEGARSLRRASKSAIEKVEQQLAPPIIEPAGDGAEDQSDEWASDTSEEAEEEQRAKSRQKAGLIQKDSLFKKVPIRSKSAADLQLLAPSNQKEIDEAAAALGASPTPAVRGLLSSMFHPDGSTTIRRGHASAADLRHNAPSHEAKNVRKTSHDDPTTTQSGRPAVQMRALPTTQVGSFAGSSLKLSKSAVALPVLSTTGSRSTAQTSKRQKAAESKEAAVFDDSDDDDGNEGHHASSSSPAGAVDRLHELSQSRKQRNSAKGTSRSATGGTKPGKRGSHSSLEVQVEPELDEAEIRRHRRTTSPSRAEPVRRSQSAVDVPDTGLPQSPRTTRRNMLRDELSESLRQNLLWERKSRNRMLGIGVPSMQGDTGASRGPTRDRVAAPSAEQSADTDTAGPSDPRSSTRGPRGPTVLSSSRLRPLTARSTGGSTAAAGVAQTGDRARGQGNNDAIRRQYTGDFHHTGW